MSGSGIRRQQWGKQQRAVSDDHNDAQGYMARALIESLWAMNMGDAYRAIASGVGGVLGGYLVTAQAGTNNVVVSPGIALIPAVPDDDFKTSPMTWIQTGDSETIDLAGYIDGGFPRLVTIEIAANLEIAEKTEQRGKIDPQSGKFGSADFDVVVGGAPTYTVNAGVASSSPVVAAGVAGRIPLAVVKLTAAQASFADPYASVLLCRPMLDAVTASPRGYARDEARGGGLSVGEESGGSIGSLDAITVHGASVLLAGLPGDPAGTIDYGLEARTIDGVTPGSLTGSVQPVYAYAAPPPWASTYGAIAPREAWQRNPNQIASSVAGSVIGGDGDTFLSLRADNASLPGRNRRNAIVFFDTQQPQGWDEGDGNAPVRLLDARGPHPTVAAGGGGSITLDDTQDPTWGATQVVDDAVYLGALASVGTSNFVAQSYEGGGEVRLIDTLDTLGGNPRRPVAVWTTDQNTVLFYPARFPDMLVGDDNVLPPLSSLSLFTSFTAGNGPGTARFTVVSDFGYGKSDSGVFAVGARTAQIDTATADDFGVADPFLRLKPRADGAMIVMLVTANSGTVLQVGLSSYVDAFLAAR